MRQQMEAASGAVRERSESPLGFPLLDLPACAPIASGSNMDKLAYASPKVQSTIVVDGNLLPDVLAEWSGDLPDDFDAPISIDGRIPSLASDADACRLRVPGPRRNWWDFPASLRRRADVLEYPIDNEALLYDPTFHALYHMNETAFFVWRRCGGQSPEYLASALMKSYDVEYDTAIEHVTNLVELLLIGGLFAEEPLGAAHV